MSWQEEAAERFKDVEEEVESFVPRRYAARVKIFLDRFLPYSIVLLASMIVLTFFVNVGASTARLITYLNWVLISYFCLRLAMAFRLAESDTEFLKRHWFDALLVLPAFTLLQEVRSAVFLGEELSSQEAAAGVVLSRNAGVAARIAKIFKIARRSLSF